MMGSEFRYHANFTFSMRWAKIALLLPRQPLSLQSRWCITAMFGGSTKTGRTAEAGSPCLKPLWMPSAIVVLYRGGYWDRR